MQRISPPKGPSFPPECSNTQLFAQVCALAAASSLQVKGEAPCWARIELCAERYCSISLPDVEPPPPELLLLAGPGLLLPELLVLPEFWFPELLLLFVLALPWLLLLLPELSSAGLSLLFELLPPVALF